MADNRDFFVFLLVAFKEGFYFPCSLAQLLGGLVDYLLRD